jgi:hypothetical protein
MTQAVVPPPDGGYPSRNTAEGENALFSLDVGVAFSNTAVGFEALYSDTTGSDNTALGSGALQANTTGLANTAIGSGALVANTTGQENTAVGHLALWFNVGNSNTALGAKALSHFCGLVFESTGGNNTATGAYALTCDTTGSLNTANGTHALASNTSGNNNTAFGAYALYGSGENTGDNNTAMGFQALYTNTAGIDNTASGLNALFSNTEGNENTADGHSALQSNTTGNENTAVGHDALFNNTTGSNNIALGHGAGSNLTTGNNNIDIGFFGVPGEANTIRIGTQGIQTKTFVAGINGAGVTGLPVKVDANGQLGTTPSSARFKRNIKPLEKASDAIFALKPVSFRYNKDIDPEDIPQFGLVAEEVEKVDPALVVCDADGKPYTVRYEAVNAMLLNEFLKEHRKVEQLRKDFELKFVKQQNQIEALTAGLQRASAQIEVGKVTPKAVVNNSHN